MGYPLKRSITRYLPESTVSQPRDHARAIYAATLFASALLLFVLEPMVAKRLLPAWGGSPSVWLTCTVFFQAMLLAGYLYAHLSRLHLPIRRQIALHVILVTLSIATLPFGLYGEWKAWTGVSPAIGLLATLTLSVGVPFFTLSASAPLLQHWFASAGAGRDPYLLYAASNLGSLIALLAYPILLEPNMGLRAQGLVWGLGLVGLGGLLLWSARFAFSSRATASVHAFASRAGAPSVKDAARWTILALVPSSLMLGLTTYFTTDIASLPLLWVMPLALYLLSFVIVFSDASAREVPKALKTAPFAATFLCYFMVATWFNAGAVVSLLVHLGVFFVTSVALHGKLAASRPAPQHLTTFFLWISFGGMLGGLFNSIVAPLVFSTSIEYGLALAIAASLCAPVVAWKRAAIAGALVVMAAGHHYRGDEGDVNVLRERNFFGSVTVIDRPNGIRKLLNGTTVHGAQNLNPGAEWIPITYYHPYGPIGQIFAEYARGYAKRPIGVIGLGIGTLAAWARPGQSMTFFEIDDKVVSLANQQFSYLHGSKGKTRIVLGDARLKLQEETDGAFAMLFVDAFSSDAIPVHLLTKEAIALYLRKIAPDGILAIHFSNRHLALGPIVARLAAEHGLTALTVEDQGVAEQGRTAAKWAVLARRAEMLSPLVEKQGWKPLEGSERAPLWTDDFTSFMRVLILPSWL